MSPPRGCREHRWPRPSAPPCRPSTPRRGPPVHAVFPQPVQRGLQIDAAARSACGPPSSHRHRPGKTPGNRTSARGSRRPPAAPRTDTTTLVAGEHVCEHDPGLGSAGPKRRPASFTPSEVGNATGVESAGAALSTENEVPPEQRRQERDAGRTRGRRAGTPTCAPLLAQLHPLVPGALQKLLVLLLAHLLPALLD